MRAILSLRPKCSHRCVSLKESPLKPVLILKHATRTSTEQTSMRTKGASPTYLAIRTPAWQRSHNPCRLKKSKKRAGKNNKLNFLWPKMACFPKIPPSFPGNEAHTFFLGPQNGGFWVGAKKFMLQKFMCFFRPPKKSLRESLGESPRVLVDPPKCRGGRLVFDSFLGVSQDPRRVGDSLNLGGAGSAPKFRGGVSETPCFPGFFFFWWAAPYM